MSVLRLLGILAVVLSAAANAQNRNPALVRAEARYDALEFVEVLKELQAALAVPRNERKAVIRIYELQGICEAILGRDSAATSFGKLLALEPDHTLERSLGPRILGPFYQAKGRLGAEGALKLELTSTPVGTSELRLDALVRNDSLAMARKVRFHVRVAGEWKVTEVKLVGGAAQLSVSLPKVGWWAQLTGELDAVLIEQGSAREPKIAPEPKPPAPPPLATVPSPALSAGPAVVAASPGLSGRRKLALGVLGGGLAAVGGGAAFGLSSNAARAQFGNPARDEQGRLIGMTAERTKQLEAQAKTGAILANTLFAVGAGLAAAGSYLWLTDGTPAVALAPSPSGIAIAGTF